MASAIRTISLDNTPISQDKRFTYLVSDISAGTTSIKVQNTTLCSLNTSTNAILQLGEIGSGYSEIVYGSITTSPSGGYIYLNGSTAFDHPQDTKVYLLDWDSVELSRASTADGTKTALTISGGTGGTIALQVEQSQTIYNDTEYTSGFYFTRFYDTRRGRYAEYSDPIPYAGFADNTVKSIKKRALNSVNQEIGKDLITDDFLNTSLWEARREVHNAPGKRSWRQRFNVDIGNVSGGMYKIATPSDLDEPDTAKNLFGVRIGTERNLDYRDKKIIDEYYQGVPHSFLTVAYDPSTSTQIFLENSRDFDFPSGSITAGTFSISYSANDITKGSLIISTQGTSATGIGTDVWQNVSLGLPNYFTVARLESAGTAYILFERPIDQDYQGKNIYADYYRTLVEYDSDADTLDEPGELQDAYVHYLAWKIKKKKNQGLSSQSDDDFLEWERKKMVALSNEREGQTIRFQPDMPDWSAF